MTQVQVESAERIKQYFAVRVINQARVILEVWQRIQLHEWTSADSAALQAAAEHLHKQAVRFSQPVHAQIAGQLLECLAQVAQNRDRLTSESIEQITQIMQALTRTGLRKGEQDGAGLLPLLRCPVYVALADAEQAQNLISQLGYFKVQAEAFSNAAQLHKALSQRHPPLVILDVDFDAPGQGLTLMRAFQDEQEKNVPVLFYSQSETDAQTRLAAVRAGGEGFFVGELETSRVLDLVEYFSSINLFEPYRVLVVDDSRAQAVFTERALNSAAIITRSVNDPTLALAAIMEFSPDLIILDMYMPQCSGIELAKVIRQCERFVSMPIIYLSGEENLAKQLTAMSQGADDFLTKPIRVHHLVATVRNRAARARALTSRMVRDSLTGLYAHTHILQLLGDAAARAIKTGQPLSFVMLDIDYFKQVNDRYGHPLGDRVIKSLASYLKQRLRKTDHIGRYGGEEFALVMPNTDAEVAAQVVDSIRVKFSEIAYQTPQQSFSCTFSAGVAQYEQGMDTMLLAAQADEALYVAKNKGRNQVSVYIPQRQELS